MFICVDVLDFYAVLPLLRNVFDFDYTNQLSKENGKTTCKTFKNLAFSLYLLILFYLYSWLHNILLVLYQHNVYKSNH